MPNHWESSARPLFVRTVFVNGNRHAILFEEDPHLRYGNSSFKKISRSNSSLSFISDLSLSSSESQDSNSDEKVTRLRNNSQQQQQQQQQGKDLSSELQSCLIKLRLASGNLANRSKSDEEKISYNSKVSEDNQEKVSKQKKHKWKRQKSCRGRHCESFQEESEDNNIQRHQTVKENSCFFYNCESNKRKKNYCVVKISSQPPQFTLSCTCDGNLGENHMCRGFPSDRKNMLISATIHNLCMTNRKNKSYEEKFDNPFSYKNSESFDFYWNTYLTRSYYNSLSERVLQWLDLASKKKKQKQKLNTTDEGDILNSIERIFSGKTFINESRKTENSDNTQSDKALVKKKDNAESNAYNEETETETEVAGESNEKSFLPTDNSQQKVQKSEKRINSNSSETESTPSEIISKSSIIQQQDTQTPTKSPLKIQDLLLDYNIRENFDVSFGKRSKRKIREARDFLKFSKTHRDFKETDSTEEDEIMTKTQLHHFEKKMCKRSHKSDTTLCNCDGNPDIYADKIRSQLLSERISETKQKSINNLNFTRGRSVIIQNLLSSQQHEEISAAGREKIVWESAKDTGRLQLHIFLPSLLLREASEDSMSECENVFNLC